MARDEEKHNHQHRLILIRTHKHMRSIISMYVQKRAAETLVVRGAFERKRQRTHAINHSTVDRIGAKILLRPCFDSDFTCKHTSVFHEIR